MFWHGRRSADSAPSLLQFGQKGQARKPNSHGSLNLISYMYAAITARASRATSFRRVWYKGRCTVASAAAAKTEATEGGGAFAFAGAEADAEAVEVAAAL